MPRNSETFLFVAFSFFLFQTSLSVTFDPESLNQIPEGTVQNLRVILDEIECQNQSIVYFRATSTEPWRLRVIESTINVNEKNSSFLLEFLRVGRTTLVIEGFSSWNESIPIQTWVYPVSIIRTGALSWMTILATTAAILNAFGTLNLGCNLDTTIIIETLKKPIGPVVGFVCQYGFMPFIAFLMGVLLLKDDVSKLGLFVIGCSPGGLASNLWTVIFRGNVDLSVTMTVVSTIAALGMMPLWLYTLGMRFQQKSELKIPYMNIFPSLLTLIGPLIMGLVVQRYLPSVAKLAVRILRPVSLILLIVGIVVAIVFNFYAIYIVDWRVVVCGLVLSWSGFAFGSFSAWMLGRKKEDLVAISIETAFQNSPIGFMVLNLSLNQPDIDIASIPITVHVFVTSLTLLFCHTVFSTINYFRNRNCVEYTKATKQEPMDQIKI